MTVKEIENFLLDNGSLNLTKKIAQTAQPRKKSIFVNTPCAN